MLTERHYKNEDKIKDMIVDGHSRGVCNKHGGPLPVFESVFVANEQYRNGYDKIDWSNNG